MTRRDVTGLFRCNGLDVISSGGVSTPSVAKPDLHSAMLMVKRINKRCWDCYVLERDRFGGAVWLFGVEKWVTRRRTLLSCKTISMHNLDDGYLYFTERNGTESNIRNRSH